MLISLRNKQYYFSVISLIVVIMVVCLCFVLANWQLQRADNKQKRLNYLNEMQRHGVLGWSDLKSFPSDFNKTGLQLEISGTIQTSRYWLLDNRTLNGRPGYDVIAAFTPTKSQQALLVNFGWVAQGLNRNQLPDIKLPDHQVSILVQLKQGELAGFYLKGAEQATQGWPKLIQFINLKMQENQSAHSFVNFMAYATQNYGFAKPHYNSVVMPPEKHQAYALQWLLIGFSALCVFIFATKTAQKNKQYNHNSELLFTQIDNGKKNDK
ncbi:SURF1 family protein [Pseudoalteromonas denitrificans]|uniref:SURF1-like protein n=1 Tax=Pseudoalteromonas denitrificans DSM 6059 TaxID=1123010 RepID=A0A1I1RP90_9GAMM|nr:SURF1 family protein [Pseudoalteromonas denitrificans]SFD36131.1 Cytochrome oxidase assembly protein ShyY1 [Pseudoalteromonas denitrificans DSM 6059]